MNIPDEMIPLITEALYTHRWKAIKDAGNCLENGGSLEQREIYLKDAKGCADAIVFLKTGTRASNS